MAVLYMSTWYIGGMTNWDAFQKEVSLDFLGKGNYQAESFMTALMPTVLGRLSDRQNGC
jgi:hypothetical protein